MTIADDWAEKIRDRVAAPHDAPMCETPEKDWGSASGPVLCRCSDGFRYVVKDSRNRGGQDIRRVMVTEQIVGRLGARIQAPVANVNFVDVPAELIARNASMAHMLPGLAHGSKWIVDCTDREGVRYQTSPGNPGRFALLAVLYTWTHASDHQFIYEKAPPNAVHSVDHGYFFHGGPDWTVDTLRAASTPTRLDAVFDPCNLQPDDVASAGRELRSVTEDDIATIVSAPPDTWGLTLDERVSLAGYLAHRRSALLAFLPTL